MALPKPYPLTMSFILNSAMRLGWLLVRVVISRKLHVSQGGEGLNKATRWHGILI